MAARPERAKAVGIELEDRGALHEVEHAEAGREAGAPRRGENVVRPRHIVADDLRGIAAEKDAPALRISADNDQDRR